MRGHLELCGDLSALCVDFITLLLYYAYKMDCGVISAHYADALQFTPFLGFCTSNEETETLERPHVCTYSHEHISYFLSRKNDFRGIKKNGYSNL